MSFEAMTWAVKQECGSAAAKLVLLMLANHSNGHTGQCNPRLRTLANECEMRPETLRAHIKALESRGLLEIVPQFAEGVQLPNHYTLKIWGGGGEKHGGGGGVFRRGGGGENRPPYNQELNQEEETSIPPTLKNSDPETQQPIAEPEGSARVEMPTKPKKTRQPREKTTLKTYLENCKANAVKPIPADHPVRAWAEDAGIPDDMLQVAWITFRETYVEDPKHRAKLYADWPAHFANSVKGNWGKVWWIAENGDVTWTAAGMARKKAIEAKAAREVGHG